VAKAAGARPAVCSQLPSSSAAFAVSIALQHSRAAAASDCWPLPALLCAGQPTQKAAAASVLAVIRL